MGPDITAIRTEDSGSNSKTWTSPLSTYISHNGAPACALDTCRVVISSGAAIGNCGTGTQAFFSGSETGGTLTFIIDTTSV